MASHPLISIITVTFNAVGTLKETIKSVANQDFSDFEYLIIDGGSTDGTVDLIQDNDVHIAYWISEVDKGIYDAMNKGIKYAKGDYIYFLGADDVLADNTVLNKVASFLTESRFIYYGNVLFKKRNSIYDGQFDAFKIVTRNISHQSIFYPRALFNTFTFNTKYNIFADYDLNLRLFNHKYYRFKYMNLTIAVFNDEGASGLNTFDKNFEADRLSIIKTNFNFLVYLYRYLRTKLSTFFK